MPIQIPRILQVLHMLENLIFLLFSQQCQFTCFIFLVSIIGVIIFHVWNSILKFYGKEYRSTLHLLQWIRIRIQIDRPWMWIRNRKNDAAPTGSRFTILIHGTDPKIRIWRNMYILHYTIRNIGKIEKIPTWFCSSSSMREMVTSRPESCGNRRAVPLPEPDAPPSKGTPGTHKNENNGDVMIWCSGSGECVVIWPPGSGSLLFYQRFEEISEKI